MKAGEGRATKTWKRDLFVKIDHVICCNVCKPYRINSYDPGKYDIKFVASCPCAKKLHWIPNGLHALRKIEAFYAVYKENGNEFPAKYFYGLTKGLDLNKNHLLSVNSHAPYCLSPNFVTGMKFKVVHCECNRGSVQFFCKNKTHSCTVRFSEIIKNVSEELQEKAYRYKKRLHGIDVDHPFVGEIVDIRIPDVSSYNVFTTRLKEYLLSYDYYEHPSIPRFYLLQEAAIYEREKSCRMCLIDCIFDTWFVKTNNDFVHDPFFLSLDDFIGLQNNKCGVRRKRFSRIINCYDRQEQFKNFIIKEKLHLRNAYVDRQDNTHGSFCVPEDGHVFEEFLETFNINLVPDSNCVLH